MEDNHGGLWWILVENCGYVMVGTYWWIIMAGNYGGYWWIMVDNVVDNGG